MHHIPEDRNLCSHCCENFMSQQSQFTIQCIASASGDHLCANVDSSHFGKQLSCYVQSERHWVGSEALVQNSQEVVRPWEVRTEEHGTIQWDATTGLRKNTFLATVLIRKGWTEKHFSLFIFHSHKASPYWIAHIPLSSVAVSPTHCPTAGAT